MTPRNSADTVKLDREIGARVRTQRVLIGLSQTALGAEVGVTFQQIQKYEQGRNRITGSRMIQIAKALKVDPSFLGPVQLAGGKRRNAIDDLAALVPDQTTLRLLRGFQQLVGKPRTVLVMLVETIAKRNGHGNGNGKKRRRSK